MLASALEEISFIEVLAYILGVETSLCRGMR